MEGGDVYDCIDVNVQPTLGHPLLKHHKIQVNYVHEDMNYNHYVPQMDIDS